MCRFLRRKELFLNPILCFKKDVEHPGEVSESEHYTNRFFPDLKTFTKYCKTLFVLTLEVSVLYIIACLCSIVILLFNISR